MVHVSKLLPMKQQIAGCLFVCMHLCIVTLQTAMFINIQRLV